MAEYAVLCRRPNGLDAGYGPLPGRNCGALKGKPALVDSSSPRYGEKASYYSAVCLETGEVEWMELEGNSNSGTSVAFLTQLKEKHPGPLRVIWVCAGPSWGGGAGVPQDAELELRLVNLAGLQPGLQRPLSGVGRERRHWQSVLGQQGGGQERVGKFLPSSPSCQGPKHSRETVQMHIPWRLARMDTD